MVLLDLPQEAAERQIKHISSEEYITEEEREQLLASWIKTKASASTVFTREAENLVVQYSRGSNKRFASLTTRFRKAVTP
jgi:hypothetical protein